MIGPQNAVEPEESGAKQASSQAHERRGPTVTSMGGSDLARQKMRKKCEPWPAKTCQCRSIGDEVLLEDVNQKFMATRNGDHVGRLPCVVFVTRVNVKSKKLLR